MNKTLTLLAPPALLLVLLVSLSACGGKATLSSPGGTPMPSIAFSTYVPTATYTPEPIAYAQLTQAALNSIQLTSNAVIVSAQQTSDAAIETQHLQQTASAIQILYVEMTVGAATAQAGATATTQSVSATAEKYATESAAMQATQAIIAAQNATATAWYGQATSQAFVAQWTAEARTTAAAAQLEVQRIEATRQAEVRVQQEAEQTATFDMWFKRLVLVAIAALALAAGGIALWVFRLRGGLHVVTANGSTALIFGDPTGRHRVVNADRMVGPVVTNNAPDQTFSERAHVQVAVASEAARAVGLLQPGAGSAEAPQTMVRRLARPELPTITRVEDHGRAIDLAEVLALATGATSIGPIIEGSTHTPELRTAFMRDEESAL